MKLSEAYLCLEAECQEVYGLDAGCPSCGSEQRAPIHWWVPPYVHNEPLSTLTEESEEDHEEQNDRPVGPVGLGDVDPGM